MFPPVLPRAVCDNHVYLSVTRIRLDYVGVHQTNHEAAGGQPCEGVGITRGALERGRETYES